MSDNYIDQLGVIASELNGLHTKSDATLGYDIFADALYWTDELPSHALLPPKAYWCIRPVFRHRTALILEDKQTRYLAEWNEASRLFPSWPGFNLDRVSPNNDLKQSYWKMASKNEAEMRSRFGE